MAKNYIINWLDNEDVTVDFAEITNRTVEVRNARLADFIASPAEGGVILKTSSNNSIILKNAPAGVAINVSFRDGKKTYEYLSNLSEGHIYGTDKANTIVTTQNELEVEAGAGNDKITVNTNENTVHGQQGNDKIIVNGNSNYIYGDEGADAVTVYGYKNEIYTNEGNDTIVLKLGTENSTVDAGEINNTIDTGADNDKITVYSENNKINASDGNDTIYVYANNNTISGGAGDDKITIDWKKAKNITLNTDDPAEEAGNDLVTLKNIAFHDFVSVVFSEENNTMVFTDANGDTLTIANWKSQSVGKIKFKDCTKTWAFLDRYAQGTIIGTEAYDNINVVESEFKVESYAGNDKITVNGDKNTVSGGLGNDNITINGNYNTISGGLVKDNIDDIEVDNDVPVGGESGNDVFTVNGTGNTIYGEDGADTVTVNGADNKVYTHEGNDKILLKVAAKRTKVDTGAGNDKITVNSEENTINAGDGDDIIAVSGSKNTIDTGKGNDKVTIDWKKAKDTKIILSDDGKKTLTFTNVNLSEFVSKEYLNEERTDIKLTTATGNYLILENLKESNIASIKFKKNKATLAQVRAGAKAFIPDVPDVLTPTGIMSLFMKNLVNAKVSGVQALDEAVYVSSYGKYENFGALVDEFKNNILENTGERYSDEQTRFLKDYCNIILDNVDTGSISGSDAGGPIEKSKESVVPEPEGMTVADFVYTKDKTIIAEDFSPKLVDPYAKTEKKEFYCTDVAGVTLYWSEDNWNTLGIDHEILEQLLGGVIKAWTVPSLELAKESYGLTLTDETSILTELENGKKGIQVCFENNPDSNGLAYVWYQPYSLGEKKGVDEVLVVNTAYYHDKLTDVNGSSSDEKAGLLDRTIAHELVHAVMAANIVDFDELPLIIKEGTAELAHGVDDERRVDILDLTDTTFDEDGYDLVGLLNAFLDYKNEDVPVTSTLYGAGYMVLRYLTKSVMDSHTNTQDNAAKLLNDAQLGFTDTALAENSLTDSLLAANKEEILKVSGNV